MIQTINNQINCINDALAWIKKNKPDQYEVRFMQLIEERRKLRKLAKAEMENPAIAAFGESQKGKSYLMGNLLQKNGVPFMVKINGGKEEENFVQNVNPIGNNKEATGVVTRFTTFKDNDGRYNPELPVIVKLLSPSNLATILCIGYYKNVTDHKTYSDKDIEDFSQEILNKYKNLPDSGQTAFIEDDILEIKNYLSKYVTETQGLLRSNYFDNLALVIRKIPTSEWVSVLKYLWHENHIVSAMFTRLINTLQKMSFANEVYTDIETVRHYGDNSNTIMSVDCLNGLDNAAWDKTANVSIKDSLGNMSTATGIPKCELAAVCAETIYKVEKDYVEDMMSYKFYDNPQTGDMPRETLQKLNSPNIKKELLNSSDLLDFPGARNFLNLLEQFLDNKDENGTSNAVQMLLRGKVSYLFNDYSESRIINILLFCHDADQVAVNGMYIMVNDWVEKYVGRTFSERRKMIEMCGGTPPLFNICTKFNKDMIEDEHEVQNSDNALNQRWSGRLNKVLYTQAIKANDVDWFKNWDGPGNTFKNSYLLRDFKYSNCTGSGNNLYEGFKDSDPTPTETRLHLSAAFYDRLRQTFINNPDVQIFFKDPAMAWDLAATRNNDGALFIIDRLTLVAKNMHNARDTQFRQQIEECRTKLLDILNEYHVSENTDEKLQENIRKANSIIREMDFTCNDDNYFFGHLLQTLQITETKCLQIVHEIIQSGELGEKNNNFSDYEIILKRCRDFAGCNSPEECWDRLKMTYGMRTKEEAEAYLTRRNVEPSTLFSKNFKKKINSAHIADRVFDIWKSYIKSVDFKNKILTNPNPDRGFDDLVMDYLTDNIKQTSEYLRINEVMDAAIANYVNVINYFTINESLVADIMASTINGFVITMGYELLSEADVQNAIKIVKQYNLPVFDYINKERKSYFEEGELTTLFDDLTESPKTITASFEDNYYSWLEYMFVSFIAHIEIPEYDREANEKLKQIINNI